MVKVHVKVSWSPLALRVAVGDTRVRYSQAATFATVVVDRLGERTAVPTVTGSESGTFAVNTGVFVQVAAAAVWAMTPILRMRPPPAVVISPVRTVVAAVASAVPLAPPTDLAVVSVDRPTKIEGVLPIIRR